MTLDLKKIWELLNTISQEQCRLEEKGIYIPFLGHRSEYFQNEFENFLEYYSFKIEDDNVVIYNNDGIPYEDYNTDDFSYLPIKLLDSSAVELEKWLKEKTEKELIKQEEEKKSEQERIKLEIERLQRQLF